MKRIMTTMAAVLLAITGARSQTMTGSYTNATVSPIPDGNLVGVTEQFNVSGLGGSVSNVTVTLDITGGFNGDLYAYLLGPQGQMAVLLNRVGVTGSNPLGYGDAGMDVTLAASGNDIHYYDSYSPTITGGQLTGTWAADGRNIDPQSSGTVFDGTTPTAGLAVYQNTDADGTWTLFIADLAAGDGNATLQNAFLSIMTVPEPQTWVIVSSGIGFLLLFRRRS